MRRRYNLEAIIQILILLSSAALLLYGILSGKVNYYIHPRYQKGIWISIAACILFAIRLTPDIKKARHNVNLKPYIIFVIPFFVTFLFPPAEITKAEVILSGKTSLNINNSNRKTTITDVSKENDQNSGYDDTDIYEEARALDAAEASEGTERTDSSEIEGSDETVASNEIEGSDETLYSDETADANSDSTDGFGGGEINKDATADSTTREDTSEKYNGKTVKGATVIEDDYFASWYYDLYDYLDDFTGKRYQFLAQVYTLDDSKENQFLAGRYVMVCCAADVTGYGIICESNKRKELKDDEWITVTATIGKYEYNGTEVPILKNAVITKAEAPKDIYAYYNFY
jgi:putative membrane protein